MPDVTMPRLSDTMQEGTIARWLKHPGDPVERGEILAEIETDKATMELEAYDSGVLQEVLVDEGQTAPIGEPIARIGEAGEAVREQRKKPEGARPAQPAEKEAGALSERAADAAARTLDVQEATEAQAGALQGNEVAASAEPAPGGNGAVPRPSERRESPKVDVAPPPSAPRKDGEEHRVKASPMARRLAEEHGLDLAAIEGSGPEGRVVRANVEDAIAAQQSSAQPAQPQRGAAAPTAPTAPAATAPTAPPRAPAAAEPGADYEDVPLSNMRRVIARRMLESTQTIPHFNLTTVVDVTELGAMRGPLNEQLAGDGVKVTVTDLLVKACAISLRRVPALNVSFLGESLRRHLRVHIGIAVALEEGLIVPVIRDADRKALVEIAREARELAERARAGRLKPEEYSGGTFTISNLGMFGIEHFTAVINPPEAAILAVGAAVSEPVVRNGAVEIRERMRMTMAIDHRAVDGATGAQFLQRLKDLLESPMALLAH